MLAFVVELFFGTVVESALGLFFPSVSDVRAVRESSEPPSEYGYAPKIVGFAVFLSLLITGLWFSYLRS